MGLRVDQIEEDIAARVAAIDASPFDQRDTSSTARGASAPAFTEADSPLVPEGEARPLGHLRFSALADGAIVTGDRQAPSSDAKTVSGLVVQFLYRLRAGKNSATPAVPLQRIDQRLAARAASAIVRAVKAFPQDQWQATVLDAWSPTVSEDGEWLLVDVSFSVLYEMPV